MWMYFYNYIYDWKIYCIIGNAAIVGDLRTYDMIIEKHQKSFIKMGTCIYGTMAYNT